MEGLPQRTRRLYLAVLIAAFVIIAPTLGLYAAGYRISENLSLIKTGGIHVDVPRAGASFYLDDKYKGSGSLFQKSFFTQNLLPDTYTVRIDRAGYHSWRKELVVRPTLITEGRAFLLPEEPVVTRIPRYTGEVSSTTVPVSREVNPRRRDALEFFSERGILAGSPRATSTIAYEGATTTVLQRGGIGLWQDADGLHAWWLEDADASPYFFCRPDDTCEREILVAGESHDIRHFDFLPSGNQFVIMEWPDGIYVTELDTREPQNIQPLYPVPGASFRIIEGEIIILDGEDLYELSL